MHRLTPLHWLSFSRQKLMFQEETLHSKGGMFPPLFWGFVTGSLRYARSRIQAPRGVRYCRNSHLRIKCDCCTNAGRSSTQLIDADGASAYAQHRNHAHYSPDLSLLSLSKLYVRVLLLLILCALVATAPAAAPWCESAVGALQAPHNAAATSDIPRCSGGVQTSSEPCSATANPSICSSDYVTSCSTGPSAHCTHSCRKATCYCFCAPAAGQQPDSIPELHQLRR